MIDNSNLITKIIELRIPGDKITIETVAKKIKTKGISLKTGCFGMPMKNYTTKGIRFYFPNFSITSAKIQPTLYERTFIYL